MTQIIEHRNHNIFLSIGNYELKFIDFDFIEA